jgi:arsenite methyltransferase
MKTTETEKDEIKTHVRARYGAIAEKGGSCGCAPSCCGRSTEAQTAAQTIGYTTREITAAPEDSNLGLGCGNPQAIAALRPGQAVLDLGSGAGFDAFIAARAVGENGRVIGVDMTPAMITKARQTQARHGFQNVEFRLGEIEHLPVANASVDVILSNCVINLSPDKAQVFREAFRVLKPGGRLALADVVALGEIPEASRRNWELYTGCIAGAASIDQLKGWLREAGFVAIRIQPKPQSREILGEWFPGQGLENVVASATIEALKPLS